MTEDEDDDDDDDKDDVDDSGVFIFELDELIYKSSIY